MADSLRGGRESPIGSFHALVTRDAVGLTRDGWPYFRKNPKGLDPRGYPLFEIQFGDGEWMLAVEADLREPWNL